MEMEHKRLGSFSVCLFVCLFVCLSRVSLADITDFNIRDGDGSKTGPEVNFQRGDILRMLTPSS